MNCIGPVWTRSAANTTDANTTLIVAKPTATPPLSKEHPRSVVAQKRATLPNAGDRERWTKVQRRAYSCAGPFLIYLKRPVPDARRFQIARGWLFLPMGVARAFTGSGRRRQASPRAFSLRLAKGLEQTAGFRF